MLRVPLLVALALAVAFAGGLASAITMLRAPSPFGAIAVGPWRAYPDAQTDRADPYARARRAREGDLLLGGAEGLMFSADTDGEGRPLSGACRYAIAGTTPQARFWTFRITDGTGRPLASPPGLPNGLHAHRVLRAADGSFSITAAKNPVPGNWVVMRHQGPVRFVLTLYDTPAAGSAGLVALDMPHIARLDCPDA